MLEEGSSVPGEVAAASLLGQWSADPLPFPFRVVRWYWKYMPIKRGGMRLAYAVSKMFGASRPVVATLPGCFAINCDLSNTQYHFLYTHDGVYEPGTLRIILNALKPGDTFIDVGSNWGFFSLLAGCKVGSGGHVFAFDPNPVCIRDLERHRDDTGLNNIQPVCLAVSDVSGEPVTLTIPRSGASGLGTVVTDAYSQGTKVLTKTTRLDDYVGDLVPRVLKIDAEGLELKVLKGCTTWLDAGARPVFVVEHAPGMGYYDYTYKDILGFFEGYGYKIFWPLPTGVLATEPPAERSEVNIVAIHVDDAILVGAVTA